MPPGASFERYGSNCIQLVQGPHPDGLVGGVRRHGGSVRLPRGVKRYKLTSKQMFKPGDHIYVYQEITFMFQGLKSGACKLWMHLVRLSSPTGVL
jgi:hypothetical protein